LARGCAWKTDQHKLESGSMLSPFCGTNPIHVKWSGSIREFSCWPCRRAAVLLPSLGTGRQRAVSVARICLREAALRRSPGHSRHTGLGPSCTSPQQSPQGITLPFQQAGGHRTPCTDLPASIAVSPPTVAEIDGATTAAVVGDGGGWSRYIICRISGWVAVRRRGLVIAMARCQRRSAAPVARASSVGHRHR
jgi:hypothetical protein